MNLTGHCIWRTQIIRQIPTRALGVLMKSVFGSCKIMELLEEECKINDSVVGSMEAIDSYVQSLGCSEFVAVWRDMESL